MSAISIWHPSRGLPEVEEPRLAARARVVRSPSRRWVAAAFVLACLVAAGWWVTNSRMFDMRSIGVTGNLHLSDEELLRLTGLSGSTNVLWMSAGEVESRLEGHPWVLSADVSRTLPSGVSISLHERSPVAIITAGRPLLVAGDGTVLGHASPSARLPRIDVAGQHAIGSRIPGSLPQLVVARSLPPDLLREVARVMVRPGETVLLSFRGGSRALFGDTTAARAKAGALRAVLSWADRHGITPVHIDVRVPAAPALLPQA